MAESIDEKGVCRYARLKPRHRCSKKICELPIPRKEQEIKQAQEFIRRDSSKNQKREKVLVMSVAGVNDFTTALSLTGRTREHSGE
jgi:hypothetical protein